MKKSKEPTLWVVEVKRSRGWRIWGRTGGYRTRKEARLVYYVCNHFPKRVSKYNRTGRG